MTNYTIRYNVETTNFEFWNGSQQAIARSHPAMMQAWQWSLQQPAAASRLWKAALLVIDNAVLLLNECSDIGRVVGTVESGNKTYVVMKEPHMEALTCHTRDDHNPHFVQCPDTTYNKCTCTARSGQEHVICKHILAVMLTQELKRKAEAAPKIYPVKIDWSQRTKKRLVNDRAWMRQNTEAHRELRQ